MPSFLAFCRRLILLGRCLEYLKLQATPFANRSQLHLASSELPINLPNASSGLKPCDSEQIRSTTKVVRHGSQMHCCCMETKKKNRLGNKAGLHKRAAPAIPHKQFILGPGIADENICDSPCGTRRDVILWQDWSILLRELRLFRKLLVIVPDRSAIAGAVMKGVGIHNGTNRTLENAAASLDIAGKQHPALRATEILRSQGRHLSISARDLTGVTLFRVCIMPGCSISKFRRIVQFHQGVGSDVWHCMKSSPSVSASTPLGQVKSEDETTGFTIGALLRLWLEERLSLRLSFNTKSASFQSTFIPKTIIRNNGWLYCSDGITGLHLHLKNCKRPQLVSGWRCPLSRSDHNVSATG